MLAERLGFRHVADLLEELSSREIAAWFEYLRIHEQVQADWTTTAILKAFNGNKGAAPPPDSEPVIDTTTADFRKNFKGFIGKPSSLNRRG